MFVLACMTLATVCRARAAGTEVAGCRCRRCPGAKGVLRGWRGYGCVHLLLVDLSCRHSITRLARMLVSLASVGHTIEDQTCNLIDSDECLDLIMVNSQACMLYLGSAWRTANHSAHIKLQTV